MEINIQIKNVKKPDFVYTTTVGLTRAYSSGYVIGVGLTSTYNIVYGIGVRFTSTYSFENAPSVGLQAPPVQVRLRCRASVVNSATHFFRFKLETAAAPKYARVLVRKMLLRRS